MECSVHLGGILFESGAVNDIVLTVDDWRNQFLYIEEIILKIRILNTDYLS